MEWQQVVLIGWFLFGTGATVAMVGRPREPITTGLALFTILTTAVIVALVVTI